jgi:L-ascorbate metabolism protein UlaG (beta-lactamase superfamily)
MMTGTAEIALGRRWLPTNLKTGSVLFIGTATTLIRYAGFTILTDPNFLHAGDHVHLGYGLRSKRLTEPAMELDDLPALDFVLLSHMHEDHFDRVVQERLTRTVPIVTTPDAAQKLNALGFEQTQALDTWQPVTFRRGNVLVRITAMPGRHGGPLVSKLLPPVMGSMVEFGISGGKALLRLYISGDTLLYRDLKEIPERYPDIDLALMHLGGTRVMGMLVTMDGKQGISAVKLLDPQIAIPIHYNDYGVFKSPLEDFQRHVREAGWEDRIRYLSHGETYRWEVPKSRR